MKAFKVVLIFLLIFFLLTEINARRNNRRKRKEHSGRRNRRKHSRNATQAKTLPLKSTSTETIMTTASAETVEKVDVICTKEGVENLIQGYVIRGKISFFKVLPLKYGTYSDLEVVDRLQTILAEANLPPLPFCKDGKIAKRENITQINACTLDINLRNLSKSEAKLRQMEEAGILPLGTVDSALHGDVPLDKLKRMILEAEITAGRMPTHCLNQTSDQESNCANRSIMLKLPDSVQRLFQQGEIPSDVERAICESSMNKTEILAIIVQNDDLVKTFIPEKVRSKLMNRSIPLEIKTLIVSGENISEILRRMEKGNTPTQTTSLEATPRNEVPPTTIASSISKTTNKNANAIDPEMCTVAGVKSKIEGYVFSGLISLDKILPIVFGNYSDIEMGMLLNETLVEAGLPPLPNCTDKSSNSSTTDGSSDECSLGLNATNLHESENRMMELERKGSIPSGTTKKALEDGISFAEVQQLVLEAEVVDGQIPPRCLNASNTNNTTSVAGKAENGDLRAVIMSYLPKELRTFIEEGKMPKYIEDAIFSGTHNQSEIMKLVIENDEVIKALLPPEILDLLEDRPIPEQLKVLLTSGKNETEIRKEMENNDEILKSMIPAGTYFFYKLFQTERNKTMYIAASSLLIGNIIVAMLTFGCSVNVGQIFNHVKRIKGIVIALFVQYMLMPAAALALVKVFHLKKIAALAMLVCGCCPGGNISNIFAYLSSGDVNLSVLMTTCSSLLGFCLMPLAIFIYSRFIFLLDSTAVVPFSLIALCVALTVIPTSLGVAIRQFRPNWVTTIRKIGAVVFLLVLITATTITFVLFGNSIFIYFPTSVLGCCVILPMFGYIAGYSLAYVAKEEDKCRRSISIESGSQNVILCAAVLQLAFRPEAIGVLFLAPMGYMFFQIVEGSIIVLVSRIYERRKTDKKHGKDDSEEKKKFDVESGKEIKDKMKRNEQKPFISRNHESSK